MGTTTTATSGERATGDPRAETDEAKNTDRELWRERDGDYYAASLHVTEGGGIGMDVGGLVIVRPIRDWHRMPAEIELLRAGLEECAKAVYRDDYDLKYKPTREARIARCALAGC